MAGLNLHKIVTPVLNNITPEFNIILKLFNGNINNKGIITPTYITVNTKARVYLANTQELQHINNINLTKIYKKFYINSDTITGLNKALSEAGDYIVCENLEYKIVQVISKYATGWSSVIGCQQ
jgi:hypothetical protein